MTTRLSPPDEKPPVPPSPGPSQTRGTSTNDRARILIVEDEFLIAIELEAALEEEGFDVVGMANTAENAIHLARTLRPDLIVMDIRLIGHRDGVDAADEIWRTTQIRCLFVTAHADAATRARAERAMPVGWLPKPYDRSAVIDAVRTALKLLRN